MNHLSSVEVRQENKSWSQGNVNVRARLLSVGHASHFVLRYFCALCNSYCAHHLTFETSPSTRQAVHIHVVILFYSWFKLFIFIFFSIV